MGLTASTSKGRDSATPRETEIVATPFNGDYPFKITLSSPDVVAEGASAALLKGKMQPDAVDVALKVFRLPLNSEQKELYHRLYRKELDAAARLNASKRYILPYLGTSVLGYQPVIISLYMRNGNLLDYFLANDVDRQALLLQVAEALTFLHTEAGMVHGDLKCENILVADDGTPRLADFALSTLVTKTAEAGTTDTTLRVWNTVRFAAPELLSDTAQSDSGRIRSKTTQSDIWAFGMLLVQAFTSKHPWHGYDNQMVAMKTLSGVQHPRPGEDATLRGLTDAWWAVCVKCWATAPDERPRIEAAVEELRFPQGPHQQQDTGVCGQLGGPAGDAPSESLVGADDQVHVRVKARYAYQASPDGPNEISFEQGEILEVLDKEGAWWYVKKFDGSIGFVPSNYIFPGISASGRSFGIGLTVQMKRFRAKALYSYQASPDDPDEISFKQGEILDITDKRDGWWLAITADGSTGMAPSNYLILINQAADSDRCTGKYIVAPSVVISLCTAIETYGMHSTTAYRLKGLPTKSAKLKALLDRDHTLVDFDSPEWASDVDVLAEVLMTWLRELPEPVIVGSDVADAGEIGNDHLRHIQAHEAVNRLPEANFLILRFILGHLRRMSQNEAVNLLSVPMISIIFTSALFGIPESHAIEDPRVFLASKPSIATWKHVRALETLLQHYAEIFIHERYPPTAAAAVAWLRRRSW